MDARRSTGLPEPSPVAWSSLVPPASIPVSNLNLGRAGAGNIRVRPAPHPDPARGPARVTGRGGKPAKRWYRAPLGVVAPPDGGPGGGRPRGSLRVCPGPAGPAEAGRGPAARRRDVSGSGPSRSPL